MTVAHYTPEYRRTMLISAIPALLTAFFSMGGVAYMVFSGIAAEDSPPPAVYWVLVGLFTLFAVAVSSNALTAVLRLQHNTLRLDEGGVTFRAWQHFTLSAGWGQVAHLEERQNARERVTVLILEEAQLKQAPIAKLLRRHPPVSPYPIVLDRFTGWPDGPLRRTLETHIPHHFEGPAHDGLPG